MTFGMPAELAAIIDTHQALFGGFVMEAGGDGGDNGGESLGETPPAFQPITSQADLDKIIGERVRRAKPADYNDLKTKAAEFDKLAEAQKTEAQRQADALTEANRAREQAQADALMYRAAATHNVPPEYHAMIGVGTEDEVMARAEQLGKLVAAAAANGQQRQQSVPVSGMRPMATPPGTPERPNGAAGIAEAERRFGKPTT